MRGKKILRVVFFTERGKFLAKKLQKTASNLILENKPEDMSLGAWTQECFENRLPILFIGSTGIAVRTIAPYVADKMSDSAVIVVDELGKNVIPILSGHFGGANEWAVKIAEDIDSNPVITTATDINNVFAVDVFARKNGLRITDKSLIKRISSKALKGQELEVIEAVDKIEIDGLKLVPKRIVLGIGCKQDKSFEELLDFVHEYYSDDELEDDLYAIASIDVKADEIGLIRLAQYYGVPFFVYTAKELEAVEGDFTESDFVKEQVGVGNVCERAALLAAGDNGILIKDKIAKDGMTLAIAKRVELNIGELWQDIFT